VNSTQAFLVAMLLILAVPYLAWRLLNTEHYAPLVVVQIIAGILLGPGLLGAAWPQYYSAVFTPDVVQALNGIAWWAVMCFVWLAGIELDLGSAWQNRRECGITAALALAAPLLLGSAAAVAGKLVGAHLASRLLGWPSGEAWLVGWLLQTKALIMIIFANVLLDRQIISSGTFTALLLMAVASTMLTVPMVTPLLARHSAAGLERR
jgi:Kef-type K+ transport system membrane component KefB